MKVLLGAAVGKNSVASHKTGEGHGEFLFYDENSKTKLPDYSQIYAYLLLKYKGISLLLEFGNEFASGLNDLFLDQSANVKLVPQQISEFLILGNHYTLQVGYVTKNGLSFDLRYDKAIPEFNSYENSLLYEFDNYNLGMTKYFDENNLKLQLSLNST